MAKAGDIKIGLKVESKEFLASMKRAEKAADRFVDRSTKGFKKLKTAGSKAFGILNKGIVKLAAAVSVGAFAFKLNEISKGLDKISKTSLRLNIPVTKLQELEFVAAKTGVRFEGMVIGMQRMARRVAQAHEAGGPLADTLDSMGLSAQALVGLRPDQIFEKMGTAIMKTKDSNVQLLKTFQFFDTEGVASLQAFRSNIPKLAAEFKKLGLALSPKELKVNEQWRNSLVNLQFLWNGFLRKLQSKISPKLKEIADDIVNSFKSGEIDKFAETVATKIKNAFDFIKGAMPGIIKGFKTMASTLQTMLPVLTAIPKAFNAVGKAYGNFYGAIGAKLEGLNQNPDILKDMNKPQVASSKTQSADSIIKDLLKERAAQDVGKKASNSGKGFGGFVSAFGTHVEAFGKSQAGQTAVGKILAGRGKANLGEVLGGGVEQVKSDRFNSLARALVSSVESGRATQRSNESYLSSLRTTAKVAGIGKDAGANAGLLGVIKELQTFIAAKKEDKQEIKVDVDVLFNDPMFTAKVMKTFSNSLSKETAQKGT